MIRHFLKRILSSDTNSRSRRVSQPAVEALEERTLLTDFVASLPFESSAPEFFNQTLRGAIAQANNNPGADRILLLPGFTYSITEELDITDDLEIVGNGSEVLGAAQFTISAGNRDHRVLNIDDGAAGRIDVTINGVTITGGGDGTTELIGAGISNFENLTIRNSHVTGNDAGSDPGGGLMHWNGTLNIINSVFSDNRAQSGGAMWIQGDDTIVQIINSTISGNSASGNGGGIQALEATTIRNSTITGNRADSDGNDSGAGGGLNTNRNITTLHNTIVAGNFVGSGTSPGDIVGIVQSESSFNLIGDPDSAGGLTHDSSFDGTNGGNIVGSFGSTLSIGNILDTTLQLNGGLTPTHALVNNGVAIDRGSNDEAVDENGNPLATDQRVFPDVLHSRIRNGNRDATSRVDIGSYEAVLAGPYFVSTNSDVVDEDYSFGQLSLREAVELVNLSSEPQTIRFSSVLNDETIELAGSELRFTNDVTIDGSGASNLIIDGNENSRVFRFSNVDATVTNLVITGGDAFDSSDNDDAFSNLGGGILNEDGSLTLERVRIHDNRAQFGAGINNWRGSIRVEESTIDNNEATGNGGGLYNWGDGGGANATILGSTFSGNDADFGSAIYSWDGDTSAELTVLNSTITTNSTNAIRSTSGSVATLVSSIVADNGSVDVLGEVGGHNNVIGTNADLSGIANGVDGNQVGTAASPIDPQLGVFADTFSPPTHLVLPNSPALERGTSQDDVVVTPTAVTSNTAADDLWPAARLIDGSGLSGALTVENTDSITHVLPGETTAWVTSDTGSVDRNYFHGDATAPDPVLTFTLPEVSLLTDVAVWGYNIGGDGARNGAKLLALAFSTDGGATFGAEVSVTLEFPTANSEVIALPGTFAANVVRMTITDNHHEAGESGGGRVGLSEVRFLQQGLSVSEFDQRGSRFDRIVDGDENGSADIDVGATEFHFPRVIGRVLTDSNADGDLSSNFGRSGVNVQVVDDAGIVVNDRFGEPLETTTSRVDFNQDGSLTSDETIFEFRNVPEGNFRVRIAPGQDLQVSTPASGTHSISVTDADVEVEDFGVFAFINVNGRVFQDDDRSGFPGGDEVGLNGWTIEAVNAEGVVVATAVTQDVDNNDDGEIDPRFERGQWSMTSLVPGEFTFRQVLQSGWEQTAPSDGAFTLELSSDTSFFGLNFGNVPVEPDTLPGDVDGNDVFDANDAFLIQLVQLSGTNEQIDQFKGISPLPAAEIRQAIDDLGTDADVDQDGTFNANDAFLIQLVKLAASNEQIDAFKGASTATASMIRSNVDALGEAGGTGQSFSASVNGVVAALRTEGRLFSVDERTSFSPVAPIENDAVLIDEVTSDFRSWIDRI